MPRKQKPAPAAKAPPHPASNVIPFPLERSKARSIIANGIAIPRAEIQQRVDLSMHCAWAGLRVAIQGFADDLCRLLESHNAK
ncbi:MAG: hypothetical protein J0H09_05160 [Burkholderiales bacterium]|nr:hypothetical protein [Burkholderiales bacterium]